MLTVHWRTAAAKDDEDDGDEDGGWSPEVCEASERLAPGANTMVTWLIDGSARTTVSREWRIFNYLFYFAFQTRRGGGAVAGLHLCVCVCKKIYIFFLLSCIYFYISFFHRRMWPSCADCCSTLDLMSAETHQKDLQRSSSLNMFNMILSVNCTLHHFILYSVHTEFIFCSAAIFSHLTFVWIICTDGGVPANRAFTSQS